MSGGAKLFIFILFLPFFAAVGYDTYLAYFSSEERMNKVENLNIDPDAFRVTDLGWVWLKNSTGSFNWAREMMPMDTWTRYIDPLLQAPTMLVALIPGVTGILFMMITFVLGIGSFRQYSTKNKQQAEYSVYENAKTNKMKFSKK